jgi:hypothetical protein
MSALQPGLTPGNEKDGGQRGGVISSWGSNDLSLSSGLSTPHKLFGFTKKIKNGSEDVARLAPSPDPAAMSLRLKLSGGI